MRKLLLFASLVMLATASGCETRGGSAAGGALGGAALGAGAYEINVNRQMNELENDYKAGRINKQEYEIRKDQIKRGSIIK